MRSIIPSTYDHVRLLQLSLKPSSWVHFLYQTYCIGPVGFRLIRLTVKSAQKRTLHKLLSFFLQCMINSKITFLSMWLIVWTIWWESWWRWEYELSAIIKIQSVLLNQLNSSTYSFQKTNSSIYLTSSFFEKINIFNLVCLIVKIQLNLEKSDIWKAIRSILGWKQ